MPIGDLDVPVIGKNVVIAILVQSHILIATFILGASLIAPIAEYLGMVTNQLRYERFARNLTRLSVLLFATGSALAITFVLALITLFPIFFSYLQNIFAVHRRTSRLQRTVLDRRRSPRLAGGRRAAVGGDSRAGWTHIEPHGSSVGEWYNRCVEGNSVGAQ
jgi:hypothetical protein